MKIKLTKKLRRSSFFFLFFFEIPTKRTAKTSIYSMLLTSTATTIHIFFPYKQDLHNNSTLSIQNIRHPILNFNPIRFKSKKKKKTHERKARRVISNTGPKTKRITRNDFNWSKAPWTRHRTIETQIGESEHVVSKSIR